MYIYARLDLAIVFMTKEVPWKIWKHKQKVGNFKELPTTRILITKLVVSKTRSKLKPKNLTFVIDMIISLIDSHIHYAIRVQVSPIW